MKNGYFVKYTGINASVSRNGQYLNPYRFRPDGNWVEVHEKDFEWYKKKAKKNVDWHVKKDEVAEVKTKYFAKFLGVPDNKEAFEIERYDQDDGGNKVKGTERPYVFPIGKWIEIKQVDAAFFQKKATNHFWEYDKKIITEKLGVDYEIEEPKSEPKKKGKGKKEPETTVESVEDDE